MTVRAPVEAVFRLFQYQPPLLPLVEDIGVSAATKRVAVAYERFRNTLEPDEEDVLRRKAITRILERRINEDRSALLSATAVLQELIRGNYIKTVTQLVRQRIASEIAQLRILSPQVPSPIWSWFLAIAAVSLDRELYPRQAEESLVHLMYHDIYPHLVWADDLVADKDRPAQTYIACHRVLFGADDQEIIYHYFINHFSQWKQGMTEQDVAGVAKALPSFYEQMQLLIAHPARQRLHYLLRPIAVSYRILKDVCQGSTTNPFVSPEVLAATVRDAVSHRSERIRERMNRRAQHSVLFLFFTKTVLAVLVELPYEFFLLRRIHWLALAINILFHPTMLFLLATTVRLPGVINTNKIVASVQSIVWGEAAIPTIVIKSTRRYGAITWSFFALLYALLFIIIFWGLLSLLQRLDFSLLAMLLFVVFLGLVSFLAVRVRRSADQIRVLPQREGAVNAVFSFLALPVLEFGSWLTRNISQINILLFLMDRVLEAPFKLLIDMIEEWFAFVRDRREEII